MSSDLFEKLADLPVPPVPETFDRAVHERINSRLTAGQFLDFATRAEVTEGVRSISVVLAPRYPG